jgi:hypothetical protein
MPIGIEWLACAYGPGARQASASRSPRQGLAEQCHGLDSGGGGLGAFDFVEIS